MSVWKLFWLKKKYVFQLFAKFEERVLYFTLQYNEYKYESKFTIIGMKPISF